MTDNLVERLQLLATCTDYHRAELEEAADRIEELQFVLLFISNINYGNGSDVTMEHQGWAKRALEGKK